jgi:NAD-dependent deacetylase
VGETIRAFREAFQRAKSVAVLTGAGISAESGIPTFRGPGGLWRNYHPHELATPEAFAHDPRLVWEWYDWRRGLIAQAQPNPGHLALVELERRVASERGSFTLITQNVDGLHERAGSRSVAKLHGDIWRVRCGGCGREERNEQVPLANLPPRCACGGLLRPGVVWFGEMLPQGEWRRAVEASQRAEIFLVVGTSAVVYPAASLIEVAKKAGARVAIINAEPTATDAGADWVLQGQAGEILPRLL